MADASLKKSDIDEVVLVGGSTRIPKVGAARQQLPGSRPRAPAPARTAPQGTAA
jgi:molecular chaperone DnaK (HSP70)